MNSNDESTDPDNPYSSPRSGVEREIGQEAQPLASLAQRLAGALVDGTLMWLCLLGPAFIAGDLSSIGEMLLSGDPEQVNQVFEARGYTATPILMVILAAFNMFLLYKDGQTIGKRMVGSRIVRTSGAKAHLLRILALRAWLPGLIYMIPNVGFLAMLLGHMAILLQPRRCLHDYLADTKVVRA